MSIVIAAKADGGIWMGADTQTSRGEYKKDNSLAESNLKITKMPHGVLLGHAGTVRVVQILDCHKDWFEELGDRPLSKEFLVTEIVPRLYRELRERDLTDSDDPTHFDGSFIIAQGDRLFAMYGNFSVSEIPSFVSIGCGLDAAYLMRFHEGDAGSVHDQILNAMRLSASVDSAVGAPFVMIHTSDIQFEITEE